MSELKTNPYKKKWTHPDRGNGERTIPLSIYCQLEPEWAANRLIAEWDEKDNRIAELVEDNRLLSERVDSQEYGLAEYEKQLDAVRGLLASWDNTLWSAPSYSDPHELGVYLRNELRQALGEEAAYLENECSEAAIKQLDAVRGAVKEFDCESIEYSKVSKSFLYQRMLTFERLLKQALETKHE